MEPGTSKSHWVLIMWYALYHNTSNEVGIIFVLWLMIPDVPIRNSAVLQLAGESKGARQTAFKNGSITGQKK